MKSSQKAVRQRKALRREFSRKQAKQEADRIARQQARLDAKAKAHTFSGKLDNFRTRFFGSLSSFFAGFFRRKGGGILDTLNLTDRRPRIMGMPLRTDAVLVVPPSRVSGLRYDQVERRRKTQRKANRAHYKRYRKAS